MDIKGYLIGIVIFSLVAVAVFLGATRFWSTEYSLDYTTQSNSFNNTYNKINYMNEQAQQMSSKLNSSDTSWTSSVNLLKGGYGVLLMFTNSFGFVYNMISDAFSLIQLPDASLFIYAIYTIIIISIVIAVVALLFGTNKI